MKTTQRILCTQRKVCSLVSQLAEILGKIPIGRRDLPRKKLRGECAGNVPCGLGSSGGPCDPHYGCQIQLVLGQFWLYLLLLASVPEEHSFLQGYPKYRQPAPM